MTSRLRRAQLRLVVCLLLTVFFSATNSAERLIAEGGSGGTGFDGGSSGTGIDGGSSGTGLDGGSSGTGIDGGPGGTGLDGGIGGTGLTYGLIIEDAAASVSINDINFDAATATITIDDEPAAIADLKAGMPAVVIARTDNSNRTQASADTIIVESLVAGPIQKVVVPGSRLLVLGQSVLIDPSTILTGVGRALEAGVSIKVYGLFDTGGGIRATRIEVDADKPMRVRGIARKLDNQTKTLRLGNQTISLPRRSKIVGRDFLVNNAFVAVAGDSLDDNGTLQASALSARKAPMPAILADFGVLEGYVTDVGDGTFEIFGQRVTVSAETQYQGGSVEDLSPDRRVRIRCRWESAFVWSADLVVYKD